MNYRVLLIGILATSVHAMHGYIRTIICRNATGARIGVMTVARPLTPGRAVEKHMVWLKDDEEVTMTVTERLVGWYQPGRGTGMTVMDAYDTRLTFVRNGDEVKVIHGEVKSIAMTNKKSFGITVETENPHEGAIACTTCAEQCYRSRIVPDFCACLLGCADESRDLYWELAPYERRSLTVASGAKLQVEVDNTYDEDEEIVTTIHRRVYYR